MQAENAKLRKAVEAFRGYIALIPTAYKRTVEDWRARAAECRNAIDGYKAPEQVEQYMTHAAALDRVADALEALEESADD